MHFGGTKPSEHCQHQAQSVTQPPKYLLPVGHNKGFTGFPHSIAEQTSANGAAFAILANAPPDYPNILPGVTMNAKAKLVARNAILQND